MRHASLRHRAAVPVLATLAILALQTPGCSKPHAGTAIESHLLPGSVEQVLAYSLDSQVAMAVARDGRVFVTEQGGAVRVVRDGRLLPRPFVRVPVVANMDQGMLGIALDPQFPRAPYVYVVYTAATPWRHDRVVRYTAAGDTAQAGSEFALLELDSLTAPIHVGGALAFGPDGMLYVGTGDNDLGARSQDLRLTAGKVLRIAPDGAIPADDPFAARNAGAARAIWARGLRNAFSLAFDRAGALYVGDPGENTWEEVDVVRRGANEGWPVAEGPQHAAGLDDPLYAYDHANGCCITAVAFGMPSALGLGPEWRGRVFYTDLCAAEIRWFDPAAPTRHGRLGPTLAAGPVALTFTDDGSLYYLARGSANPIGGAHASRGMLVRATRPARP